uniref:Centromere protein C n=1 Tax=Loxodonta africana TaxID=9785 RepID=G3T7N7_LOXAF
EGSFRVDEMKCYIFLSFHLIRAPDINVEQGKNILEILQDCFEEKNSTKSVPCSTPKIKDTCIQSPSKEHQKSRPKLLPASSRKKEGFIVEPNEEISKSVQAPEVHQKTPATDVGSENTTDLKNVSSRKQNDHHNEVDEEFYISVGSSSVVLDAKASLSQNAIPSIAQKKETYTSENSLNVLSSSTEISCKTKKRLNFEDISKKVEIEDKVLEGPQGKKASGTPQKRTQDSEYEIQPKAKKSFSILFLETVKRKTESSPVIRHVATDPPHSSPNDVKLLEDEFIIDESDISFGNQSLIKIPRNVKPPKQRTISPVESTVVLQGKKSREKHHNVTLTSDKNSHKAHPVEKPQPFEGKKLGKSCASASEMENNCKSTKDALYSENAEKPSENKGTIKQNRRRKVKAKVVEEHLDMEQPKDKNINTSFTVQGKLQRNSDKNTEVCEEMRNDHISPKQIFFILGKKKSRTHVPIKENQKKVKEKLKNKRFSNQPKKESLVPEEVTLTVTKSRRISKPPSNWWEVKSDQSPVGSNSSLIKNELSLHHNSRQKPAGKKNQSSKNIRKQTTPFKRQKTATQGNSRAQTFLNAKDSGDIIDHDEISSSKNEPLESDEASLAKKKNLDCSGTTGGLQDQCSSDSISTQQNTDQKSLTSGYAWEKGTDSEKLGTSILEGSGPSNLRKYVMSGKNNSDTGRKEAQKSSEDLRVKRSKVISENKIHHKLVLPSNTPNVRRTKRTRLKPLEYWRGERIDYQASQSGGFLIGGILSPDTVSPEGKKANRKTGTANKITNRKRICLDNNERKKKLVTNLNIPLGDPFQPTRVKDPETRESILMVDLVRPRDTYQFFVEHEELRVYKTLDTPFFSTGKLILGPCQEKGKQHVGLDTLVFYVDSGDLLCTLHETPYLMTAGDSFYVPSGNYYNIKNLQNEESVLLFTQIKR